MISSKLPHVGVTIFSEMSALANEHGAINLSQGFPDFPIDKEITELYYKHSISGKNQYAPMPGVLTLKERISQHIFKKYKKGIHPEEEITITAGATQAIYTAITTCIHPRDEVIVFTPAYDCYEPAITLSGGKPIFIPLENEDYRINWEVVKKNITKKTKAIIVNSPHNPTGSVLTKTDIDELEKIIEEHSLILISDEVYEHIIFDSRKHHSVLDSDVLRKRSFVTFSFGKSLHITGWKLGYCIAPPSLTKEFRKVHQFNVFSCNTPAQFALAEYLDNEKVFEEIPFMYQRKRDLFLDAIQKSRFEFEPSKGTYFQLLKYRNISDLNDVDFAKKLTKEYKLASIPISVFYPDKTDHNVLRFCFAKQDETILKAAKILCQI